MKHGQRTTMLVALSAAAVETEGLVRQRFLPSGKHQGKASTGKFHTVVDAETVQGPIAAFKADADPRKGLCDYDHESLTRSTNPEIRIYGSTRAAGWIKGFEYDPQDGLVALVDWTRRAREAIAGGEYKFVSPVFSTDKATGALVSLDGLTLTNDPYLPELSVAARRGDEDGCDLVALGDSPGGKDTSMDFVKQVAAALGLSETATAEEILAAIAQMKGAGEEVTALRSGKSEAESALAALRTEKSQVDQELTALRAEKAQADEQLAALRSQELDRTIDAAVEALVSEKKVVGEDRVTALRKLYKEKGKEAFDLATAGLTPIAALRSPGTPDETKAGTATELRQQIVARAGEIRKATPGLSTADAEMQAYRALQTEKPELFRETPNQ